MSKVIQCVPNFSEGCRRDVIERIVGAISSVSGAKVVDYSLDVDHNRSVVTFIGEPEDIRKSMLAGARVAVELIDLNKHQGGHPRIGAVDVVPVVPIQGLEMADAIALSRQIGSDLAEQLRIPIYFYEKSAISAERANLAYVRRGGYEGLKASGLVGDREPDLGPHELHPTAGATVVGAREPLIAYNVNLATNDMTVAREIASRIRSLRDSCKAMPGVKAIAVYLKSRDIAQVSTNITQTDKVSIYDVYSFVEPEARKHGVEVLESELIGAMKQEALVEAAKQAMKFRDLSEERLLEHWIT